MRIKDWLIRKLGGATRYELKGLRQHFLECQAVKFRDCNNASDVEQAHYYGGKADAFGTASRCVGDLLR